MADKILMKNEHGVIKKAYIGFSWTSLFFGFFVPMFRGDWIGAGICFAVALLVGIFTLGIGSAVFFIVWAWIYNKQHMARLIKNRYKPTGTPELIAMAYQSAS